MGPGTRSLLTDSITVDGTKGAAKGNDRVSGPTLWLTIGVPRTALGLKPGTPKRMFILTCSLLV